MNLLELSTRYRHFDFVLGISTDKAAQVKGVYGASKMLMERLFAQYEAMNPDTKYRLVRYGNVLYSTGSVLCKWKDLLEQGKQVTVTDLDATRFFWTRSEAVDLIFECMDKAKDSQPYCPEMKSMKIDDLFHAMAGKYAGIAFRKPNIIGLQPGENKHERLLEDGPFSNEVEQYTMDEIMERI